MTDGRKFYRGEVYYVRYDRSYGAEEAVGRPVLLVSSQIGLDNSPVVQCVYMTTSPRQMNSVVHINSLSRTGYVLCNQLNTIDKTRLDNRIGKISDREMAEVDRALKIVLGLRDEIQEDETPEIKNDTEELASLRVELALHKALYEKTLEKLIELRLEKDGVTEKPKPAEKEISDREVKQILASGSRNKGTHARVGKAQVKKGAKPVNVNTASVKELENIGINDQTAKNIVNYRKRHGYFISLEDLLLVPRFGRGCLAAFESVLEV